MFNFKKLSMLLLGLAFISTGALANNDTCAIEGGKGLAPNGCQFEVWSDYYHGDNTWCNGSTWHTSLAWPLIVCDVAQPTYSTYAYVLPVTYYRYYSVDYPQYYSYEFKTCVNSATSYYTVNGTDVLGNTWMTTIDWCYSRYALV